LPVSLLRHEHLVFDYPAQRLTIARPGDLKPKGIEIPCSVNAETGLFMVAATIDGDTVQLGVDNGSAGTWVSDSLTTKWMARHPDWPHAKGAAGSANFFGVSFETEGVLMRLPELGLGPLRAQDVALLGLDQSFFDWYSKKSAAPVQGFIGSNVLKNFRLEIDFPNQMTYWEKGPTSEPAPSGEVVPPAEIGQPGEVGPPVEVASAIEHNDLDIVGLTLRPEADGSFTIAGVVSKDGKPTVDGVKPGDKLIRVDRLDTANATMGAVVNALRGKPGSPHTIVLDRDGKVLTIKAKVVRLP